MLRPEKLNLCAEDDLSGSHPAPHYFGTVDDVIFMVPLTRYLSSWMVRVRRYWRISILMMSVVGRLMNVWAFGGIRKMRLRWRDE